MKTLRHRSNRRLALCGPAFLALFLCGCSQRTTSPDNGEGTALPSPIRGTAAVPFELRDLEGKTVRMQDFAGKVVLLNFWGTTCAPCKLEIPWLVEFQKQLGSKGFQVVAVSMYGETQEELKPYVAEHRMENLTVVIGNDNLKAPFGLVGFPTTFLIDREGKYFTRHDGLINRPMVEKELATLLSQ
jgi:thiol-disulfide isomerase/thioredoxin